MKWNTQKTMKKVDEEKQKDYEERRDTMIPELKNLCAKYRIDLVAIVEYKPQGVIPQVAFVDVKDQYEQTVEEKDPTLET